MNNYTFFDCANFTEPTDTHECSEVMWSNGKSCYRCPKKDCYRNGWKVKKVTEDNQRIAFNIRYPEVKYDKI